ncbi:hypothetical protein [Spirosoma foliorum]|uniref:Por secretion system C-terminal sorting domain-containing protein n=1 Tax=Spirosoma foliorum TaxID=2710596 RepID=A0A7G5GUX3_9BACT|nr:hypothetical protein [Spirosoma foliorum]QMW02665.1 hypothetical protein H3H32_32985 [Spirosoma foliorum]
MKTFTQSLLTALLLSTATLAATASTIPAPSTTAPVTTGSYKVAVFPSATPSKLNVFVERTPGQKMTVSLKSADGALLDKQFINRKQGNFHFQFDLTDLSDGAYQVEVAAGTDVTTYPVTIATKPVQTPSRTITLN